MVVVVDGGATKLGSGNAFASYSHGPAAFPKGLKTSVERSMGAFSSVPSVSSKQKASEVLQYVGDRAQHWAVPKEVYYLLRERMYHHLGEARIGLLHGGPKPASAHWCWWAFPTLYEGASEPAPRTCVTYHSCVSLCAAPPEPWRRLLIHIAGLLAAEGFCLAQIFPVPADRSRIRDFVYLWKPLPVLPRWLRDVLLALSDAIDGSAPSHAANGHSHGPRMSGLEATARPSKGPY